MPWFRSRKSQISVSSCHIKHSTKLLELSLLNFKLKIKYKNALTKLIFHETSKNSLHPDGCKNRKESRD